MNTVKLPVKYTLFPILDYEKAFGGLFGNNVVKDIFVSGYVVSKCYVLEERKTFDMDGDINKEYKIIYPFNNYYIKTNELTRNLTHIEGVMVPYVFDSIEEANSMKEYENNMLLEEDKKRKRRKFSDDHLEEIEPLLIELEEQILNDTDNIDITKRKRKTYRKE